MGLIKIIRENIIIVTGHVYKILEPLFPLPMEYIRTRVIDTVDIYDSAVEGVKIMDIKRIVFLMKNEWKKIEYYKYLTRRRNLIRKVISNLGRFREKQLVVG